MLRDAHKLLIFFTCLFHFPIFKIQFLHSNSKNRRLSSFNFLRYPLHDASEPNLTISILLFSQVYLIHMRRKKKCVYSLPCLFFFHVANWEHSCFARRNRHRRSSSCLRKENYFAILYLFWVSRQQCTMFCEPHQMHPSH